MAERYTRGGYARPATSQAFTTGDWRVEQPVHRHRTAPCAAACPAGEDPQAWLAALAEGDERGAWETLVAANPLPAITGRVCHHPCESDCNRGAYDEAIAIHGAERHLGDAALAAGWEYGIPQPGPEAPAVAVVGAGPAGLACAYHLTARGYRVTLFDAAPEAGGQLRAAIPPYRLPRSVLDAELERLLAVIPETRFRHRLGRDMDRAELLSDFQGLFLAPGTHRPRPWDVDGATPTDLVSGIELLREWLDIGIARVGRRVAVVGGGNTALDLARALRHNGAEEVHVITHEALPGPGVPAAEAMPAIPREIRQAREEGVTIHPERGVERLILRGERVVGVELVHMRRLEDGSGDAHRIAFEGTETVLDVDQVVPAVGQEVEPAGFEALVHGGRLAADEWGRLADGPVYTGGDARGDRGTVSAAVGDGRRAARALDDELRGRQRPAFQRPEGLPFEALNPAYFEPAPRPEEATTPPAERGPEVEVERGYPAAAIHGEAGRCLSCGNCLACDNCWTLCPDGAVLKSAEQARDGSHYLFDTDYCKGCGICARECPTGYIVMESLL
ncbi:MAG: FAD-dependent oxidoreductase [Thiohalospira sp.]